MEIVLIIVIVAVVIGASLGFVVSARRRRGGVLEPPPTTPRVERHRAPTEPELDEVEADEALQEAIDEAVAPAEAEAVVAEAEAIVAEAPPEAPVKPRFRDRSWRQPKMRSPCSSMICLALVIAKDAASSRPVKVSARTN